MKWYLIDEDEAPIYWFEGDKDGSFMEFDTEDDALCFLKAAKLIPFVDVSTVYPVSTEIPLEGAINLTGKMPVANGDSIELRSV